MKTPEGDLVFSNLPEQSVVTIDGKVSTVEWPGGKGPAKVTVPVGDRRVKVELSGVEVYGEEVKIETGKATWLTLRLERPESKKTAEPNPWPGALPMAGQRFPDAISADSALLREKSKTGDSLCSGQFANDAWG